jgi:long-chain acyl-CoA synthetase
MPFAHDTVVHMLQDAASRSPDGIALVCGEDKLTYAEYAACVAGLAGELSALGASGSRVVLLMGNSVDIAIATFAVQAAGAQVVPLNPLFTGHELAPIIDNAAPAVIIHDESVAGTVEGLAQRGLAVQRIAVGPGARRLTEWRTQTGSLNTLRLPDPDALSTLQYTGGTTGRPKGVDLTHRVVSVNVAQREALLPTEKDCERILAITPLFHVYAVSMGLYLSTYCRGTLIIMPQFKPDIVLAAIERERVTLLSGSPTIFTALMSHEGFASAGLKSLRLCFSGASALSEETLRRWEAATGCPICEGYGQSEAGPVLTFNPRRGIRKAGSVGIPVPNTEVEIVDTETGTRVLGTGESGEIRARGPQIMRGYRGLEQETAEALRNGWLHTGDIGMMDEDGYLHIRDRKKDMVIVSGYNVYPREIEEVLYSHPAVLEAAVIGIPDSYRGEALIAYVVPMDSTAPSADMLRDYIAERLVHYKVPKQMRIVSELPKTTVGKPDKNRLRSEARQPTDASSDRAAGGSA